MRRVFVFAVTLCLIGCNSRAPSDTESVAPQQTLNSSGGSYRDKVIAFLSLARSNAAELEKWPSRRRVEELHDQVFQAWRYLPDPPKDFPWDKHLAAKLDRILKAFSLAVENIAAAEEYVKLKPNASAMKTSREADLPILAKTIRSDADDAYELLNPLKPKQ